MDELWAEVVPVLVPALATLLVALIGVAVAYLRGLAGQIGNQVARQSLDAALAEAQLVATNAVRATEQRLVSEWREAHEDGKLTPEERAQALEAAREVFRRTISEQSMGILTASLGPIQGWLDGLLEAQVQTVKSDSLRAKVSVAAAPKS